MLTEVAAESIRLIKDNLSAWKNSNETFGKISVNKNLPGNKQCQFKLMDLLELFIAIVPQDTSK